MGGYFSYAQQTAHYFTRPHEGPRREPIGGVAAWRGDGIAGQPGWRHQLTDAQLKEIEAANACAANRGKPLRELSAGDFPLPTLSKDISRWRGELDGGRGFQVASGLPVEGWAREDCERIFWCLGLHLGRPGAQNPADDLLGDVLDTGDDADDPYVRLYRTSADIAYHCDAADVVGLLCLRAAPQGGASRIVSSVRVYDELLVERPDLAPRLFEVFELDVRNEDRSGKLRHIPIPPCRYAAGRLRTFYHSDYFRSAQRHDDVHAFTDQERDLIDLYEDIANRPELRLDMDLRPGDVQWLSNHSILHARTAYRDSPDPCKRRHLLRLWLSIGA